jgi:hypothetical protein
VAGRRSAVEVMLRIHYLQQWFGLSDPAMEEALHDMPLFREFARSGRLGWRAARRDHHPAVSPPAGEAQPGADMLRVVNDLLQQGPDDANRHGGGRHADCRAEFDQERRGRARPGDEAKPRRATTGTSA